MINVFISYSHKDRDLLQELYAQLAPLRRQRLIEKWSDVEILPGAKWEEAIWENLRKADLVLMLISADFLHSDYCYDREFEEARKKSGRVIPIVVRDCQWQMTPLKDLQAIPEVPVTSQANRDAAWSGVVKKITQVVKDLGSREGPRAPRDEEDYDGDALVALCNRQPQEESLWMRFLGSSPGAPQIYFLPGSEDALHKRFLERVQNRTLPAMLGQPEQSLRDVVKFVAAPWVEKAPGGNEFAYLRAITARAIDPAMEADAAKIKSHSKLAGRIVVMQHRLYARYWNAKMADLLRSYAEFWSKAADDRERPLFLIFFSVTHGAEEGQSEEIEDELRALSGELDGQRCTVALLPRMGCIEREHVLNWMEQYVPRKRQRVEALLNQLFASGHCLPMRRVEQELLELIG